MELTFLYIAVLAVVLGLDAFSVAMSIGIYSCSPSTVLKTSLSFGLFQFIMPILGYYLGANVIHLMAGFDRWIAFIMLFAVGVKMLIEAFKHEEKLECRLLGIGMLLWLSVATSLDALAVGVSLGILGANILLCSVVIGITAALMTSGGLFIGSRLADLFGRKIEVVGGLVLMVLSVKMLIG